jgi:signal peptidase II
MKRSALLLRVSLPVIALDLLTKLAVEHHTPEDWVYTVIPGFFDLVHRHNRGIAFSLLAHHHAPWVSHMLIAFSLAVIAALLWMLGTAHAGGRASRFGLALILGGASGNVIDRIARGSVVDFADFYLGAYHWPAFNVADAAITVGASLVIFELLFVADKVKGHKN